MKNVGKLGETDSPEEVTIEEEKFKDMLFLLWSDKSRYGQLFENMRKEAFVVRY